MVRSSHIPWSIWMVAEIIPEQLLGDANTTNDND